MSLSFQKKQSRCRKFSETPQSNQSFYPRISHAASSRCCYSTDASKNHKKQFFCRFRRSSHKTAENFLKRRKVIDLFIRAYPALLPRAVVILQTHRRTIKSSFSFFAV